MLVVERPNVRLSAEADVGLVWKAPVASWRAADCTVSRHLRTV